MPVLDKDAVARLLGELGPSWSLDEHGHLTRSFTFPDFATGLAFVNQVGELADACDHHPDVMLRWGQVVLTILTHVVHGLTQNDFVLAARCQRLRPA
jgi:4a-hydroxytetrahydrobiopterin dehydratase